MTRQNGDTFNKEYLLEGSPTSHPRTSNFPQWAIDTDLTALTTEVMSSVAVPLQAGDVVSSITFKSGATAADTPLNWWFALYTAAGVLIAQSADQTTTAWAANTVKTLSLATAYNNTTPAVVYAAIMMKATTPVTLLGRDLGLAGASASIVSSKILSQTSGTGLTATAPATIATPTTVKTVPFVVLT